jgi:5-methylcytosine-specific restriction endonuclease McrA
MNYESDEDFKLAVKDSQCVSDVLRHFKKSTGGSYNHRRIKERILDLRLDTSHFASIVYLRNRGIEKRRLPLEEVLVENSTYKNMRSLKNRLVNENILKYQCYECGQGETWNEKPLSLQIDHINGISNDHRVDNLRLLCPNCHSQTATYCGKNVGV